MSNERRIDDAELEKITGAGESFCTSDGVFGHMKRGERANAEEIEDTPSQGGAQGLDG